MIPFAHGQELARETGAQFKEIEGGHNDGFFLSGDIYKEALYNFYYAVAGRKDQ